MYHFAGLDVSVKVNSVYSVDDTGKIVREVKVASEPDALLAVLTNLLRLQTDWIGSRTAVAVGYSALSPKQSYRWSRGDAAHTGGAEGADQQD